MLSLSISVFTGSLFVEQSSCPPTAHLGDLHHAIQATFSWHDTHLHAFTLTRPTGTFRYEDATDPDFDATEAYDETQFTLALVEQRRNAHLFAERAIPSLTYDYDFGDRWSCHVTLQSITISPEQLYTCIQATGVAPCEDSGGPEGYLRLKAQAAAGNRTACAWFKKMRHDPNAIVTPQQVTLTWQNARQQVLQ